MGVTVEMAHTLWRAAAQWISPFRGNDGERSRPTSGDLVRTMASSSQFELDRKKREAT